MFDGSDHSLLFIQRIAQGRLDELLKATRSFSDSLDPAQYLDWKESKVWYDKNLAF